MACSPVKASGPENEFEQPSTISASVTPCWAAAGARRAQHQQQEQRATHGRIERMESLLGAVTARASRAPTPVMPPGMNSMQAMRMTPKMSGR